MTPTLSVTLPLRTADGMASASSPSLSRSPSLARTPPLLSPRSPRAVVGGDSALARPSSAQGGVSGRAPVKKQMLRRSHDGLMPHARARFARIMEEKEQKDVRDGGKRGEAKVKRTPPGSLAGNSMPNMPKKSTTLDFQCEKTLNDIDTALRKLNSLNFKVPASSPPQARGRSGVPRSPPAEGGSAMARGRSPSLAAARAQHKERIGATERADCFSREVCMKLEDLREGLISRMSSCSTTVTSCSSSYASFSPILETRQ